MKLILGSQSPRRKEILNFFNIPFVQIPSAFDENLVAFQNNPREYVLELSQKKAHELSDRFSKEIILTADTVVYFEGAIYNKPRDKEEAALMLRSFSGKPQSVFTAVTVEVDKVQHSRCEETKIFFHALTDEQIDLYLESGSCFDKAGAYALQGAGAVVIDRIEGCFYNAMGMPINALRDLLKIAGIDLWKHLKRF